MRPTEFHLLGPSDFAKEPRGAGFLVCASAADVDGAFASAHHGLLLRTLDEWGAGPFLSRLVHNRPTARSFQVRLDAPRGRLRSTCAGIPRSAPQWGVSSPASWLAHFNPFREDLMARGAAVSGAKNSLWFPTLSDAGVIAVATAHRDKGVLVNPTIQNSSLVDEWLGEREPSYAKDKSPRFLVSLERALEFLMR